MRKFTIKSIGLVVALSIFTNNINAQRGGRLGVITGVSKISLNNANDKAAGESKLALLNTMGAHYGIEAGYHFRYFGVSAQLMRSQAGQKYMVGGINPARTSFTYVKPTFLIHFNSNPKNEVRLSGYLGAAYAAMTNYYDIYTTPDPFTGGVRSAVWNNKNLTIASDTGLLKGNVNQQIYNTSDVHLVAALGIDVRLATKWLLGVHTRMDMGMQPIDNLNKLSFKYENPLIPSDLTYEPWKNIRHRFAAPDLTYKTIRTETNNMSLGVFVSLKYLLFSAANYEYEMNGY
jgi:hypothetical protein